MSTRKPLRDNLPRLPFFVRKSRIRKAFWSATVLLLISLFSTTWEIVRWPKLPSWKGRRQEVPIGKARGGLNLPHFLTVGRDSRDVEKMEYIRNMTKHAWYGYKTYAWGHDDLSSNASWAGPYDWYPNITLLNTPVDSLDTLYIMGLMDEYKEAKKLILSTLDFRGELMSPARISVFETVIRILGGLLAAYDLEGDKEILARCTDLADRLLPAFDTETGFPLNYLNLSSGVATDIHQNFDTVSLAEIGSLQLEFQYLSDVTNNPTYQEKALFVYEQLESIQQRAPGLHPLHLNADVDPKSQTPANGATYGISAMADSYYEYLLKVWLSTGDEGYFKRYYKAAESIADLMVVKSSSNPKHIYIPTTAISFDEKTGEFVSSNDDRFEHLACFAGGMFATGALASRRGLWTQHLDIGQQITETCWMMYNRTETGIGAESVSGDSLFVRDATYHLRPETVESLFYMWRYTHDPIYRERGWIIAQNIEKYCRTHAGYRGLANVNFPNDTTDIFQGSELSRQESFFIAETLKYLYLLFADDDTVPLEKFVFNTEAHPLSVRGHGRRSDPSKFVPLPTVYETMPGTLRNLSEMILERRNKEFAFKDSSVRDSELNGAGGIQANHLDDQQITQDANEGTVDEVEFKDQDI